MLTWRGPRLRLNLLAAFICIVFLFFFFSDTLNPPPTPRQQDGSRAVRPALTDDQRSPNAKTRIPEHLGDDDVEMVVATMKKENTSWLQEYLPDWHKNIYVVDDPTADLTVPKNKGREAMVVLTYVHLMSICPTQYCWLIRYFLSQIHHRSLRLPPRKHHLPPRRALPVAQ
jgi:hypothetical protein